MFFSIPTGYRYVNHNKTIQKKKFCQAHTKTKILQKKGIMTLYDFICLADNKDMHKILHEQQKIIEKNHSWSQEDYDILFIHFQPRTLRGLNIAMQQNNKNINQQKTLTCPLCCYTITIDINSNNIAKNSLTEMIFAALWLQDWEELKSYDLWLKSNLTEKEYKIIQSLKQSFMEQANPKKIPLLNPDFPTIIQSNKKFSYENEVQQMNTWKNIQYLLYKRKYLEAAQLLLLFDLGQCSCIPQNFLILYHHTINLNVRGLFMMMRKKNISIQEKDKLYILSMKLLEKTISLSPESRFLMNLIKNSHHSELSELVSNRHHQARHHSYNGATLDQYADTLYGFNSEKLSRCFQEKKYVNNIFYQSLINENKYHQITKKFEQNISNNNTEEIYLAVLDLYPWRMIKKTINELELLWNEKIPLSDQALILAIIKEESCFSETAQSAWDAIGLMQITYPAFQDIINTKRFKKIRNQYPFDAKKTSFKIFLMIPLVNIAMGYLYICQLRKNFDNNNVFAIHAYHVGFQKARIYRDTQASKDFFDELEMIPNDTHRAYVVRILRDQKAFEILLREFEYNI